jgi:hypothetical protein
VREYADHAPLKSSRYIAQPKRHATVGKCPEGTYKCSLLLVFEVISRITIQKAIIFVPQPNAPPFDQSMEAENYLSRWLFNLR